MRIEEAAWPRWRARSSRWWQAGIWAWLVLAALPILVSLPALSGGFRYDPITIVSGLTQGTWTTNGWLPGYPWTDGNAGVTTEALGSLAAHDWLHLRLPWWNPYSGVGLPLAAEGQNPAFFLPFVLLMALPHGLLTLRIVLMIVAGFCTFALLRRMRLDLSASLTGAALFQLNGTFAWLAHGPMLPVAFLPLMLLGVEVSRERFSLALVMGSAWSLTAGFPETACLNAAFVAIWAAVRFAQEPLTWRFAIRACGAAACGAALAAPAIWPFLEALPREFLGVHQAVLSSGLRPANWALMLLPGLFGAPMANVEALHGSPALWARAGGACDVVLVTLAVAGLQWRARDGVLRVAILAWIVTTGLRAGSIPAAVWAFGQVPLLRQANVHLYMMPAWSMGFAVLAAFTLRDWRDGALPGWRAGTCVIAAVVLLAVITAGADVAELFANLPHYPAMIFLGAIVPLCAASSLIALMRRPFGSRRGRAACTIVIANAALLCLLPQFAGTHGRRIDAGALRFLQQHAGLSRAWSLGPLVPNYGAMFGVAEIGHNYLPVPQNWIDYSRAHLHAGPDAVNFYEGWPPAPATAKALLPDYEAAGVRYALVPAGVAAFHTASPDAPVPAYHGTVMDIWSLPHAAPYWQADGCVLTSMSRESVTAQCARSSVLRRLECASPGWQATIDGSRAAIAVQDDIFQAITLPAGLSQVGFIYAPPHIAYAWGCFWAGLAAVTIMLSMRAWPARTRPAFPEQAGARP